jgi:arsenate reductase
MGAMLGRTAAAVNRTSTRASGRRARRLPATLRFDIPGTMDSDAAVRAFGALAHASRLAAFRVLVRAGGDGLAAGDLAARLRVPPSTLSFHLQDLTRAGLLQPRRRGRSIVYAVRGDAVNELFWFLGEDCCQGRLELCPPPTARIDAKSREGADAVKRPAVLFLCSRNSARSQMAEAILRARAGERFEVHSAGMRPQGVHPLTLRVLDEAGCATADLRAKDLGELLGKVAIRHAIVVCEAAAAECARIRPFAREQHYWPFPDPVAAPGGPRRQLAAFRAVRDAIAARIDRWLRGGAGAGRATRRKGA